MDVKSTGGLAKRGTKIEGRPTLSALRMLRMLAFTSIVCWIDLRGNNKKGQDHVSSKLKAIRIGSSIRILETELERLPVTCGGRACRRRSGGFTSPCDRGPGSRWCLTRTGRAKFRVSGSVAKRADIRPGRMPYPIKFAKQFMDAMLSRWGEVLRRRTRQLGGIHPAKAQDQDESRRVRGGIADRRRIR